MIGCLLVFSGDGAKRGSGWLPGLAATMAILKGMMSVYQIIFQALPLPVDRYELGAIFLYPLGLLTVASAIRRPGAATLTAILFTAMPPLIITTKELEDQRTKAGDDIAGRGAKAKHIAERSRGEELVTAFIRQTHAHFARGR